jgi:hypothetical protein
VFENFVENIEPSFEDAEFINLIDKYSNCLEQDTIRFIISIYKAEKFLLSKSRKIQAIFDFSCFGVVLWKAIELELNASIVKFLRSKYNIIRLVFV